MPLQMLQSEWDKLPYLNKFSIENRRYVVTNDDEYVEVELVESFNVRPS